MKKKKKKSNKTNQAVKPLSFQLLSLESAIISLVFPSSLLCLISYGFLIPKWIPCVFLVFSVAKNTVFTPLSAHLTFTKSSFPQQISVKCVISQRKGRNFISHCEIDSHNSISFKNETAQFLSKILMIFACYPKKKKVKEQKNDHQFPSKHEIHK